MHPSGLWQPPAWPVPGLPPLLCSVPPQDVQWLGLKEGVDYASCMDLAGLYRIWNPQYSSYSGGGGKQQVHALVLKGRVVRVDL